MISPRIKLTFAGVLLRTLEDIVATKINVVQKGKANARDFGSLWAIHRQALASLKLACANNRTTPEYAQQLGLENSILSVVKYREEWREDFTAEKQRLVEFFGGSLVEVHHIGSTAIRGLAAKPIIDIALIFSEGAPEKEEAYLARRMAALGYRFLGDRKGVGGRYFERVSRDGEGRTHAVQVLPANSPHLRRILLFQTMLRADPAGVAEYGIMKSFLAQTFRRQRGAYFWYKSLWIREYMLRPANSQTWGASWLDAHAPPMYKMIARGLLRAATRGRYGRHPMAQ